MYNQIEAVLSQYDVEINDITKGRGFYVCNTNIGMKVLVPFSGSKEKGEFLKLYLEKLNEQNFIVEQILANKDSQAVTEDDVTGERFILKDYICGTELNTDNKKEMEEAVHLLARYHKVARKIKIEIPEKMKGNEKHVLESCIRHHRELVKVKNYIRNRKKKNEFEQIYMRYFLSMLSTAEDSISCLDALQNAQSECGICHGEYNQHNVVCENGNWHMIHFENFVYSWSMMDLANFLRKMLEKNEWDIALGMQLLDVYQSECELTKEDLHRLYGILLFPEKFWKITNHYINSRKAWISARDIEKLQRVIEQEKLRLNFVENLFQIIG